MPYVYRITPFWAIILVLIGWRALPAQSASPVSKAALEADVIREIDAAEQYREVNLAGYTVVEHYTVHNSHFSMPAEVVVQTTYKRNAGKTYEVQSRSGPSLLKDRVMDRILQEEAIMSRGSARAQSLITSANYEMHVIGEDKIGDTPCIVLNLKPRFKSPHLLLGKLWVNSDNKAVVRIEGRPPVAQSFFAGRPEVVRDYAMVGDISLAQRSHATSSGLLQGKTEVTIIYENYVVDR